MADLVIDGTTIESIVMPNGEELELGKTPTLQSKALNVSSAGTTTVTPDSGYDGLDEVEVNVPSADIRNVILYDSISDFSLDDDTGIVTAAYGNYNFADTPVYNDGWANSSTNIGFGVILSGSDYQLPTQSATAITPTESSQTAVAKGKFTTGAVTVAAIPSNYVGSGITQRSSSDLTASGATVSVPAGYYQSDASKEIASGTEGTPTATKGTVSNHAISVTPSVTNTAGYISGGTHTGTAVSVSASELVSGSQTITENGTVDVTNLAEVVVDVQGGGGGGVQIGKTTKTVASAASSIQFTGLSGNPTSFVVMTDDDIATNTNGVTAVVFDGTSLHGQTMTSQVEADTGFTKSYSNGTLTITATSASFQAVDYKLVYTYGGSASDIETADVQVGSGATSITFPVNGRPAYWSCIFKSDFSTSSGYQRVIAVTNDGSSTYGLAMDSSAHAATSWSATYSGGNLTITSQGTNNGGYFHQPGYYQLTYYVDDSAPQYQSKTVTPTTSQQIVTPDSGYDALDQVTVNAIPSTYVQPTSTIGSTTYRASTSNQTIQSGTYHSAAATIAAVTQTNLSAENIKSGTTISISNGQSNLWSVTGTYTGGGGSTVQYDTKTVTASNYPTSLQFTGMQGQPKFFAVRLNASVSSSGSTTYYYIVDMVSNGTTTHGNCFRIGSTRQVTSVTSGYSWSYSGTTLTLTSSASSRSASPGAFYSGSYELMYAY